MDTLNHEDTSADTLLRLVQAVSAELHPQRPAAGTVTLDSDLDRELGFDSLGRVELLTRIQHTFNVSLPEQTLTRAETPRDLLRALQAAGKASRMAISPTRSEAPEKVATIPPDMPTLLSVLNWHVQTHAERTHILLQNESGLEEPISYKALHLGAMKIAYGLLERGLQPGQAVAIMLPTSREYFFTFFGILMAGGVPVPIYPPARLSQIEDHLRRHAVILANSLASILITVAEAKSIGRLLRSHVETLHTVATVDELATSTFSAPQYAIQPTNIALLQYTSGSTGNPKGVILTHENLLANIRAMGQAAAVTSTDVFVSWLPLYHDMGLIGAWLGSLYHACPFVVMPPFSFLAQPERWLWAIHAHRGTLSAAPNFAYELCLRKIEDDAIAGLDLSSLRMAFNGAEPVSPDTVINFQSRFARYGLRPEAVAPVYGLAESSVGLAFPPLGRAPVIDRIKREIFTRSGRAIPVEDSDTDMLRFVACGQPLPGHQIRIVDATGREVAEREEGRLEFKGPSTTSGYYRNPEQSRTLFHDGWLDSGDLAYVAGGDIFLTGRAKDLIIRAGRNLYPHELEEAVGNIAGIRKGCVAVFGSQDRATGTERLVVMAETRETMPEKLDSLRNEINAAAITLIGIPPDDIVLAPIHTVLKTSSGKIRRAASRERYERGMQIPRAAWRQVLSLVWAGMLPQLRHTFRAATDFLYAGYAWGLFWLIAPLTWLMAIALPRPSWSWSISHMGARLFVWLSGVPFTVSGSENLPDENIACIVVSNHASYLDGIILVAALPRQFSFVAKIELKDSFISRLYLEHIGSEFVARYEPRRSVEDIKLLGKSIDASRSLIFFPEGTFSRMPGLMPFHMGAFAIAVNAGVPIVPVTVRGTRSVLRNGHWFPRRGEIGVKISPPIMPDGTDWAAAIRLRDATRAEILSHCGEPGLSI